MKKNYVFTLIFTLILLGKNLCFGQFTSGRLVVLQVGDGSSALTSAANPIFLKEFNTTGTAGISVALPTTGTARLTASGTSTSDGQITRSADGKFITIAGYDAAVGTASVTGTTSMAVNRVVNTADGIGSIVREAFTSTLFNSNNFRSAVKSIANDYWGAGGNSGTQYLGVTTSASAIQTAITNTRVVNIFNGNLYFATGSGTAGIYSFTGLPTATAASTLLFATGAGSSPYSFAINAAGNVAYVADDRTTTAGGVQKWTLSSSVWSLAYTFNPATGVGARGLAVDFSGTNPILYATTTNNKLVSFTDLGSPSFATDLATAPTNTAFRGLTFAPVITTPTVNITASSPSTSEGVPTPITITATASAPVVGDQTITLTPSGTASVTDYNLASTTVTILNGQTTGSTTITAIDDILSEGNETATFTMTSPTSGLVLGTTISTDILILDNDCNQTLTLKSTATSSNGAEISAFDPINDRIFTVAGPALEYYTLGANGAISTATNVPFGFSSAGNNILPNSVAIKNGIVAVSYAIVNTTTSAQQPGIVAFYNANDASFISQVTVGYLPDMLTFTPDGAKVLTANEGEPNSYNQSTSFDPEGSVSIIDVSGGFAAPTVVIAGFTSFNANIVALKAAGVRIYSPSADPLDANGPNATVAEDLEPEYITFNSDATKALITLQEANAIAELDIATATITQIIPLGLKDHNLVGNGLDASDRDINFPAAPPASGTLGKINIQNWPIKGMYQPDAIASFNVAGNTYYITANEGDTRAYTGFTEEIRVGVAGVTGYTLDPTVFPNAATLKLNQNLGRLQLSNATGDTDNDGDFDEIHANGARSFTIWSNTFSKVFDSGDQLEQITATLSASSFNSDGLAATFDTRSDNKGPEPEAVTTGMVDGVLYAFVGSERTGDIFVYDVSNPTAPIFKQYINTPADQGVEGIIFVSAMDSPTGKALVISSAEVSKTVSVFEFSAPVCGANVITGVVTEDADGGTIDGNPLSVSGAYISLFKSSNTSAIPDLVAPVASGTGAYEFPAVADDTYTMVIGTSPAGSNVPSYPNVGGFSMKASAEGVSGTLGDGNANGKTKVTVSGSTTVYGSAKVAAPAGVGFASAQNVALPIKLISFEGKSTEMGNELTWKTSSEENFSHFEIERSSPLAPGGGISSSKFENIGQVNGSSSENYKFLDSTPPSGVGGLYRLKSVDFDGKFEYSKIIFINKETEKPIVGNIYPNPATGTEVFLNIYATDNEQFNLNIYDFTGKIISTEKLILPNGENKVKLNIGENNKGLLIIKIENKSNSYFRKLVK